MDVAEASFKGVLQRVMDTRAADVAAVQARVGDESVMATIERTLLEPFERVSYSDLVSLLQQPQHAASVGSPPAWGDPLRLEHEKYVATEVFGKPVEILVREG